MHPWLTYCILIFFAPLRGGLYMSFILSISFCTFLPKNNTANHRSFQIFSWYMSFILSIEIFTFHTYRIPQFAVSVSPLFFRDLCPYIINDFLLPFSQYSNFFNAMHTYSSIPLSEQIRASIFVINTF